MNPKIRLQNLVCSSKSLLFLLLQNILFIYFCLKWTIPIRVTDPFTSWLMSWWYRAIQNNQRAKGTRRFWWSSSSRDQNLDSDHQHETKTLEANPNLHISPINCRRSSGQADLKEEQTSCENVTQRTDNFLNFPRLCSLRILDCSWENMWNILL